MSKFNLLLTPLLSVPFWHEFNWVTLQPFLPVAVSILIYLVSLLTWRRSTRSEERPEFSQIYQKISDVFLEIHSLSSAFVSPTDQPSQSSDLTTSVSQSPEPEPVQQPEPLQEVSQMRECPIYTCPFNSGGDLGCSLDKCAYFKSSEDKKDLLEFFKTLAVSLSALVELLYDYIYEEEYKE